jgi:hypothetical protein
VSAAYYSLFHLLVRDAVANWREAEDQPRLVRLFDHKQMKSASAAMLTDLARGSAGAHEMELRRVAEAFVELQQARHKADYDVTEPFKPSDAALLVARARLAMGAWERVKSLPSAQRYLYSLLFRDRA